MRVQVLALGLAFVGACGAQKGAKPPGTAPPLTLVLSIVSTNDVHGQLERLPYMAGFVKNLREARARDGGVLLVDAGDAFQGTLESNLNEGKALISTYGVMGYAALALGNHEFDFGPEGEKSVPKSPGDDPRGALQARVAEARFPILAANLVTTEGRALGWKNLAPSTLTTVAGVKVGIVGLLTADAPDVIKRPDFAGLRVTPLAETAAREARALRDQGAEVVIVLAHAGGECRNTDDPRDLSSCDPNSEIFRLAREVPPGLVDAVLGGHRNGSVAQMVGGVPVAHVPSNLVAFSRIDLVLDGATRHVVTTRVFPPRAVCSTALEAGCGPGEYEGSAVRPDAATFASIEPAVESARALRNRPIGVRAVATFPVDKTHEMALGNLFADLMREAVPGADGAFGNAGSVRDVLPEGDITFGGLHHVMPFDNQLAKVHLTGKDLRALVTGNLTQGEHGLLSLSGIGLEASCRGGMLDVTLKRPDGAAVRDDEALTLVTNDFLALGGDGLLASLHLPDSSVELDPDKTVLGALIEGLAKRRSVSPSDPILFDPRHPRMKLPGELPLRCDRSP